MVRPAAPPSFVEYWDGKIRLGPSIPPLPNGDYVCICSPWQKTLYQELMAMPPPEIAGIQFPGTLGEYLGFRFVDEADIYEDLS